MTHNFIQVPQDFSTYFEEVPLVRNRKSTKKRRTGKKQPKLWMVNTCNRTLNGPVRSTRTHSYLNTSDAMVKWKNVTAASYIDNRQQCNVNVYHSISRRARDNMPSSRREEERSRE